VLLVDTNVLLDVVERDPAWAAWSVQQLRAQAQVHELAINPVIYAELSLAYESIQALDLAIDNLKLKFLELPRAALFLAGRAHRQHRRDTQPRGTVLADFFIGAHAAVMKCGILTRDVRRYRGYFPRVPLISP
jgi:predicted nucleic acid-binding protein